MSFNRNRSSKGFSLVELLAVVLILAVLAAVAVPLYINTRKTSAARACKANIATIATAEAAYSVRTGQYCIDLDGNYDSTKLPATGLVGAPEGLSAPLTCPLDNKTKYTICTDNAGAKLATSTDVTGQVYIHCGNDTVHVSDMGTASSLADWNRPMAAKATEANP